MPLAVFAAPVPRRFAISARTFCLIIPRNKPPSERRDPRKARLEADLVRIGGEHAGDERRDDRARRLRTQAPRRERVHRFILAGRAMRGDERLAQEVELAAPGQQVAAHERHRIARQQPQRAIDVDVPALRGGQRLLGREAELVTQGERTVRWAAEERARRVLAHEAIARARADDATDARPGFEHRHVVAGGDQRAGGGQAAEATTDDR